MAIEGAGVTNIFDFLGHIRPLKGNHVLWANGSVFFIEKKNMRKHTNIPYVGLVVGDIFLIAK